MNISLHSIMIKSAYIYIYTLNIKDKSEKSREVLFILNHLNEIVISQKFQII